MKLEHRTDIQSYYDLASVSNNNINFVAFLFYLSNKPKGNRCEN